MKKIFIIMCLLVIAFPVFAAQSFGVLMVVKGSVKILKKDDTSTDARISSKVFPEDTVITGKDSRAKIVMSDRNIINVLPETKLRIDQYINNEKEKNVRLSLIQGKVRNNVEQKYDNEKNRFEVKTATAVAGVRGTQFITSFDKQTNKTEIVTLKGEVAFQGLDATSNKLTEPVVVKKGETSQNQEAGAPPATPTRIDPIELKKIESESVVRKEPVPGLTPEAGTAQQPSAPAAGNTPAPTDDVKTVVDDIKKGGADTTLNNALPGIINKTPAKVIVTPQN